MRYRSLKVNAKPECIGCSNCSNYPYFHYIPENQIKIHKERDLTNSKRFDIEYIKYSENHSEVINHTTGVRHEYKGKDWNKI